MLQCESTVSRAVVWNGGSCRSNITFFRFPAHSHEKKNGQLTRNFRLELGAGGGLVGLAVALACNITAPIYITDQINMLPLMEQNVKLNNLESRVTPLVLNWYLHNHTPPGLLY